MSSASASGGGCGGGGDALAAGIGAIQFSTAILQAVPVHVQNLKGDGAFMHRVVKHFGDPNAGLEDTFYHALKERRGDEVAWPDASSLISICLDVSGSFVQTYHLKDFPFDCQDFLVRISLAFRPPPALNPLPFHSLQKPAPLPHPFCSLSGYRGPW